MMQLTSPVLDSAGAHSEPADRLANGSRGWSRLATWAVCLAVASCGGGSGSGSGSTAGGAGTGAGAGTTTATAGSTATSAPAGGAASDAASSTMSAMARLGAQMFSDTALSASGQQSCATCHVTDHAYSAADNRSVPLGGPDMLQPGLRSAPSLNYASFTPAFHFEADGTPVGGFFRDGRAASLADQAQQPLITSFEMANTDAADVRRRLLGRPYVSDFRAVFGAATLDDPKQTLASIGAALAAFQNENPALHPFSSKFDAYQSGTATLTALELKGLALFNNPAKSNCSACHVSTRSSAGTPPLFTDYTYDSVGVPRNWAIPANLPQNLQGTVGSVASSASAASQSTGTAAAIAGAPYGYYDLGLCGPQRTDLASRASLCGAFKVPTLRNVAVKQHYFHNGVFDNLNDVVTWYVTRDTDPARWYRTADGGVDTPYNDLPLQYQSSINVAEVPYNPGLAPALTATEINAIVVFLCTLTDGYDPAHPDAYTTPAQCARAVTAGVQ